MAYIDRLSSRLDKNRSKFRLLSANLGRVQRIFAEILNYNFTDFLRRLMKLK